MSIDVNQLRELLEAIATTDITELTLKTEDFELQIRKGVNFIAPTTSSVDAAAVASLPPSVTPVASQVTPPSSPETATPETSPTPSPIEKQWIEVTSPMVGTFYRAPAPDEAVFVEVGERISKGQTVCIIEAMKLMNEIEAEVAGEVMEIAVDNGQPVEYGQTLMWVNPS